MSQATIFSKAIDADKLLTVTYDDDGYTLHSLSTRMRITVPWQDFVVSPFKKYGETWCVAIYLPYNNMTIYGMQLGEPDVFNMCTAVYEALMAIGKHHAARLRGQGRGAGEATS